MLTMNGTNVSYSAVSQNEDGEQLASMSANYSGGSIYFGLTVDKDSEIINEDFDAFKEKVVASVASIKG